MDELVAKLKECISPFKFGKLDLKDRLPELEVHVSEESVVIGNWFDYRPENVYGDCGELMVKAHRKIAEEIPGLLTEAHWGYDNKVFNMFIGWHAFLAVRESPDSPMILVDPAFQKVEHYSGSGYCTEDIESNEVVEAKLASLRAPVVLNETDKTLLGIDQETGLIYYIGMNLRDTTDDVLMLTTFRNMPPEFRDIVPMDKRVFAISPCPEEVRKQAHLFELAYQLEKHIASQR